jgi:hypothetical protein
MFGVGRGPQGLGFDPPLRSPSPSSAFQQLYGVPPIDCAMTFKEFGAPVGDEARRCSPATCTGVDKRVVTRDPDEWLISTSYVERQNLTMRMGMRRFTRVTNAFSKKVENLTHAVNLHFMH